MRTAHRSVTQSKWFLPAFSLFLGVAILVASGIGGSWAAGAGGLGVMAVTGAIFLLGGRSETIRGLRGDGRDERFAMIDVKATAFAGTTVIAVIIVAWLVEIAGGHDGNPYGLLGAAGGLAYVAALLWLRRRS